MDVDVKTEGNPNFLDKSNPIYKDGDTLYINTWVGSQWDVFCKHGGINMHTLYEQWGKIFKAINKIIGSKLELYENKEDYLPRIDYSKFDLKSIDNYVSENESKTKILICNNTPNSSQSFQASMDKFIVDAATNNPDIDFICTDDVDSELPNIKYTSQIIGCNDGCDLQEISYLSTKCDVIVGKNSGPYVFCETYDNYMDSSKSFFSFNTKHKDYDDIKETMSNGLNIKCRYKAVPILDIVSLSTEDKENITQVLEEAVLIHEKT